MVINDKDKCKMGMKIVWCEKDKNDVRKGCDFVLKKLIMSVKKWIIKTEERDKKCHIHTERR